MEKYLLIRRRNMHGHFTEYVVITREEYDPTELCMSVSDDREALEKEAEELYGLDYYSNNQHLFNP
jgi:hypothetical protein